MKEEPRDLDPISVVTLDLNLDDRPGRDDTPETLDVGRDQRL